MEDEVIEVLNDEHGKKVIEYWKDKGINTGLFGGFLNKADNDTSRFYGVIDGRFSIYSYDYVKSKQAKIITLPEEEKEEIFPKIMMVSMSPIDERYKGQRRVVQFKMKGYYYAWASGKNFEEAVYDINIVAFKYAKDIEPVEPVRKVTIAELEELFDCKVEIVE